MQGEFIWNRHPKGAVIIGGLVDRFRKDMKAVQDLHDDLYQKTSSRMVDWIDHMLVPWNWVNEVELIDAGFQLENITIGDLDLVKATNDNSTLFPLFFTDRDIGRLYLKVEDIEKIASLHNITDKIEGRKWAPRRKLMIGTEGALSLGAIERRGYDGYLMPELDDEENYSLLLERLMKRDRELEEEEAYSELEMILDDGIKEIGKNRTADAFFYSERRYWEASNEAGRIQLERQNRLGLGWGNDDHHTFRCSRENFTKTIAILEKIGMEPRERFYAGEQAGWGAQVMEHNVNNIAVFADVDLTPKEKDGDFAHRGLEELDKLGTVGLWVGLHGESMHSAGLHHLAALVDFSKMMEDSDGVGIKNMAPFSSFPYLKQNFTDGEYWNIVNDRPGKLYNKSLISKVQMERFLSAGARGSHLEFIERNDGFKGFNQEAVSDIIDRTDPRK
jgi:hypothetical protein